MVTTCVDQLSNLVDADCTLSIDAASLHECVGIVSCCCDVSANTTADSAQSTERQVNQWVVRSIQLNRLVCARDSDLIGFLHSCKEVSTLTCTVRPRAEALSAHSVSEADKRCSAFEACIGALFDTDCWALCKVVMQISWTTGSVVCPDGAAAATRRTATAAVDGLFYPVGKSRALLIVDNGCSISSGSTRRLYDLCTSKFTASAFDARAFRASFSTRTGRSVSVDQRAHTATASRSGASRGSSSSAKRRLSGDSESGQPVKRRSATSKQTGSTTATTGRGLKSTAPSSAKGKGDLRDFIRRSCSTSGRSPLQSLDPYQTDDTSYDFSVSSGSCSPAVSLGSNAAVADARDYGEHPNTDVHGGVGIAAMGKEAACSESNCYVAADCAIQLGSSSIIGPIPSNNNNNKEEEECMHYGYGTGQDTAAAAAPVNMNMNMMVDRRFDPEELYISALGVDDDLEYEGRHGCCCYTDPPVDQCEDTPVQPQYLLNDNTASADDGSLRLSQDEETSDVLFAQLDPDSLISAPAPRGNCGLLFSPPLAGPGVGTTAVAAVGLMGSGGSSLFGKVMSSASYFLKQLLPLPLSPSVILPLPLSPSAMHYACPTTNLTRIGDSVNDEQPMIDEFGMVNEGQQIHHQGGDDGPVEEEDQDQDVNMSCCWDDMNDMDDLYITAVTNPHLQPSLAEHNGEDGDTGGSGCGLTDRSQDSSAVPAGGVDWYSTTVSEDQQKLLQELRADVESSSVPSEAKLLLLKCFVSSHCSPLECSHALHRIVIQTSKSRIPKARRDRSSAPGQRQSSCSISKQFLDIAKLLKRLCKHKIVADGLLLRAIAAACLVLLLLPMQLFVDVSTAASVGDDDLVAPRSSEKVVGYVSYALSRLSIVLHSVFLSKSDLHWLLAFCDELQPTAESDHAVLKPIPASGSPSKGSGGVDRLVSFLKRRYSDQGGCETSSSLRLRVWSAVLAFDFESQRLIESPIKEPHPTDIPNSLVAEAGVHGRTAETDDDCVQETKRDCLAEARRSDTASTTTLRRGNSLIRARQQLDHRVGRQQKHVVVRPVALQPQQSVSVTTQAHVASKKNRLEDVQSTPNSKHLVNGGMDREVVSSRAMVENTPMMSSRAMVENTPMMSSRAMVENTPMMSSRAMVEDTPMVSSRAMVENTPMMSSRAMVENTPMTIFCQDSSQSLQHLYDDEHSGGSRESYSFYNTLYATHPKDSR